MPIINRIADYQNDLTAWRRDLHEHPELAMQEVRTSAVVQEKLKAFGLDEIHAGIGKTGVVGVIRGRGPGPAIGLRADMDALPILEDTGLPYASKNEGVMHACGHDGHTTMLLGAARYLAETRNFDGTVYVIFQPAEENFGGADQMVKDGLFERFPMQQVYGMHNWPSLTEGVFQWREGPIMAAVAFFEITVTGHGTHGAQPHLGIDTVVISAQIITALQTLVSRNMDPSKNGVVSIGAINGGAAHNVIPEVIHMKGTARWFVPEVGDLIEAGISRLAQGIAASFGARAEVVFNRISPATVNDPEATAKSRAAAETVAGPARVQELALPSMGSEDFAYMLEAKPGSYILLGGNRTKDDAMVHHPKYDFNDAILPVGASYWATLAEQLLPRTAA